MLTPDGTQHLLFRDGGRSLQLAVTGASVLHPVHLLADALSSQTDLRAQHRLLACLSDLYHRGRLRPEYFLPDPRGRRLRVVLQALDGWRADASYREIGVAVFGARRVATDWADPRRHLLDRVRRAVARGRALMAGGYRQFLR
ncbi:MAG: DUF2285 domain-containing protein [Alphaproteobacteria bacterium]|nr:DUF2285 domain-containing protein [Alphaproteobacteria bacterium]